MHEDSSRKISELETKSSITMVEMERECSRKIFELEKRILNLELDCVKKDLENERLKDVINKKEKEENLIDIM